MQGKGLVASGEIRSGSGYVILWPGAADALLYYIDFQGALTWALAQAVLWPDLNEQPPLAPQSVGQGPVNDPAPATGAEKDC